MAGYWFLPVMAVKLEAYRYPAAIISWHRSSKAIRKEYVPPSLRLLFIEVSV